MVNLTVEQYIKQNCKMREQSHAGIISDEIEWLKQYIEIIHNEICTRMEFRIPIRFVNSYDVNSYILPLNNKYYHVIDMAMFEYFYELWSAMEDNSPNYAVFVYRYLKHDICISKQLDKMAMLYKPSTLYVDPYDIKYNLMPRYYTSKETDEFSCMLRFYFLHEYAHYLLENPIRNASNELVDTVVEELFRNLSLENNSHFKNNVEKEMQKKLVNAFKWEWEQSSELKEEVYCDFQAILCLLELPGLYSNLNVELILNAAMSFMYIQHIIAMAKNIDDPIIFDNWFSFRHHVIAMFAYLLEDKEYSRMLCRLLQKYNRYFRPYDLQMRPMDWRKQQIFYMYCIPIFRADKEKKIEKSSYVFPCYIQTEF